MSADSFDHILLLKLLNRDRRDDGRIHPAEPGTDSGMFANVGKALIRLRENIGLSQTAVARKAGVGKSQLSKYENGKELPKLDSLERVLNALGVDYIFFFWIASTIGESRPMLSNTEVDDLFSRLSREIFMLHRTVAKETPDG